MFKMLEVCIDLSLVLLQGKFVMFLIFKHFVRFYLILFGDSACKTSLTKLMILA